MLMGQNRNCASAVFRKTLCLIIYIIVCLFLCLFVCFFVVVAAGAAVDGGNGDVVPSVSSCN